MLSTLLWAEAVLRWHAVVCRILRVAFILGLGLVCCAVSGGRP